MITELKKITQDLTGLKLKFKEGLRTCFQLESEPYRIIINIDLSQLKKLYKNPEFKIRNFNVKNYNIFVLQCLLHEIAHFKKYQKYDSFKEYKKDISFFYYKAELLADRYSLRYYKKFKEVIKW